MYISDIHMHIIPNVDDGSAGLEESIAMINRSVAQGVGRIIATPHSWALDVCGTNYMLSRFDALERAVEDRRIPIVLDLGCEMLVYPNTVNTCIRKLNDGVYPTIAGSNCVLTEFDPAVSQLEMEQCIERIVSAGCVQRLS